MNNNFDPQIKELKQERQYIDTDIKFEEVKKILEPKIKQSTDKQTQPKDECFASNSDIDDFEKGRKEGLE